MPFSSSARRSARSLLVPVLLLLALSGCRVGVHVGVDTRADGTGTVRAVVTLDRDAAARIPDLATQLRTDDLTRAGWRVTGPSSTADGGVTVEASHPFRSGDEERRLVEQLSGPTGPFRDFRLRRTRSFLRTTTRFSGTVDLSAGAAGFSDPQLTQRLGSPFGVDEAALEKELGSALSRLFEVEVAARLPGSVTSNAPTRAANGAVWRPKLGERAVLRASSSRLNVTNIVLAAASVLLALAFVAIVVRRLLHRRS